MKTVELDLKSRPQAYSVGKCQWVSFQKCDFINALNTQFSEKAQKKEMGWKLL